MASLNYKAYTTSTWWTEFVGDAYAIDELFSSWIASINLNNSQASRSVEVIYNPSQGVNGAFSFMGNLTRFPVGTDEYIYWQWAGTPSGMRIVFSEDWQYSIANNGYGGPNTTKRYVSTLGGWDNADTRGYLVASSIDDNREFFAFGWNTGDPDSDHNAMIMYKDRYGGWGGMSFDPNSMAGMFYSATNNTYNTPSGNNLTISTAGVLVPLTIPFASDSNQDYTQGQFISQPANPDIFALNSISEFGRYVTISAEEYVTSLGYNAFWIRHGSVASNINASQTFMVTVVTNDVSNETLYYLDGVPAPDLTFQAGLVYAFDQSDASNLGNPLAIFTEFDQGEIFYDSRDQLQSGVIKQGDTLYVSISTADTSTTELWYGSETNSGLASSSSITVEFEQITDPDPDPTPDPDPEPTPEPEPPDMNFYVSVVNITGSNLYYFQPSLDQPAVENPVIQAVQGFVFRLDQSNASNSGHPIAFYTDANKTQRYTAGYTYVGTPGQPGAYAEIDLGADLAYTVGLRLYYQCVNHAGMGGAGYIEIVGS